MGPLKHHSDLIVDVGVFDGFDTALYLSMGYRVVGVEADPVKVRECAIKLSKHLTENHLQLLNLGVAGKAGVLPFYRNFENEGWSSFIPEMGQRGGRFEEITVPCVTLASILEQYGVPHYLKIDIEGMDETAISTLTPQMASTYISVEAGTSQNLIESLSALGYSSFKLIKQELHTTSEDIYDREFGWRLLRKMGRIFPSIRKMMSALPDHWHSKTEWTSPYKWKGLTFDANSTGPFGEDTHGRWIGGREAKERLTRAQAFAAKYNTPLWMDVHAKLPQAHP